MSDPIVDYMRSKKIDKDVLYKLIKENSPNKTHLEIASENCLEALPELISYGIQTNCGLIKRLVELRYGQRNTKGWIITGAGRLTFEEVYHCVQELIHQGFKTEDPVNLCKYGIRERSISIVKYQLSDLTEDQKLDLINFANDNNFNAAAIYIKNNIRT